MTISALPIPPSRSDDPGTFSDKSDAFLGALPTFVAEANALALSVNADEAGAESAAAVATTQAGIAATQAGVATTKAGEAASSASSASESVTAASNWASAAAASFDQFDDRFLGSKSSDPALDNDGDTLQEGAIYWKSSTPRGMRVYNGTAWETMGVPISGGLTTADIGEAIDAFKESATQAEMEAGAEAELRNMSPLRVKQAVVAQAIQKPSVEGTAGQVPVSQGAGLPPVWGARQDVLVSGTNIKSLNGQSLIGAGDLTVGGGSMIFLSEIVSSNSSTISFTSGISSTYDEYVVHGVFNLNDAAYFDLSCRLQAGGTWIESGSYRWSAFCMRNTSPSYSQGSPATEFTMNTVSAGRLYTSGSSSMPIMFQCRVKAFGQIKLIECVMLASDGNNHGVITHSGCFVENSAALSGIRFFPGTSSFAGNFRLYGIKKS